MEVLSSLFFTSLAIQGGEGMRMVNFFQSVANFFNNNHNKSSNLFAIALAIPTHHGLTKLSKMMHVIVAGKRCNKLRERDTLISNSAT